jgi:hypothetical protein
MVGLDILVSPPRQKASGAELDAVVATLGGRGAADRAARHILGP